MKEILVTCPECGARISEDADPCPKCAFVSAGKCSKEFNEYWVEKAKKSTKKLRLRELIRYARCVNCGWFGSPPSEPIKIEVVELEPTGYGVQLCFRCPKCGGLVYEVMLMDRFYLQ